MTTLPGRVSFPFWDLPPWNGRPAKSQYWSGRHEQTTPPSDNRVQTTQDMDLRETNFYSGNGRLNGQTCWSHRKPQVCVWPKECQRTLRCLVESLQNQSAQLIGGNLARWNCRFFQVNAKKPGRSLELGSTQMCWVGSESPWVRSMSQNWDPKSMKQLPMACDFPTQLCHKSLLSKVVWMPFPSLLN